VAKPKWPLFLLAWLSLVPILGFFFGSLAAGWGLVSSRPRALVAAGIGAGGALLNLIGLFGLAAFVLRDRPELALAKAEATRQALVEVVAGLETYREQNGSYPASLPELSQRLGLRHPVNVLDPSAGFFPPRPFQYELGPDGGTYRLYSVGADKEPGTPDDIFPALPDSLAARSGLRNPSDRRE
jgi:hypothetical protein